MRPMRRNMMGPGWEPHTDERNRSCYRTTDGRFVVVRVKSRLGKYAVKYVNGETVSVITRLDEANEVVRNLMRAR